MILILLICFTYKKELGVDWVLLLKHDSTGGVMFSSLDEAKFCDLPKKYSIIGCISNFSRINGKFEFLLEYPGISGYNRWKQTNFPLWEPDNNTAAIGFEAISLTWTDNNFGGLFRSTLTETLFDGSIGNGYWYYAVGVVTNWWSSSFCSPPGDCFPGPITTTQSVELWMRVGEGGLYQKTYFLNKMKARAFLSLFISLIPL